MLFQNLFKHIRIHICRTAGWKPPISPLSVWQFQTVEPLIAFSYTLKDLWESEMSFFFFWWLFSSSCGQYTLVSTNTHIITFFVNTFCKYLVCRNFGKWRARWSDRGTSLLLRLVFLLRFVGFFYCHNRTLVLSLLPLDLFAHQLTGLPLFFFSFFFFPSCQGHKFRLEVLVSPAAAHESMLVGQDGYFWCLWSEFCLTFTTGTPHRANIKSNFNFFSFFSPFLLHWRSFCYLYFWFV